MKVGDLFVALGFQVDDKKLKEFNDNIKDTTKLLGATAALGTAAVYAIRQFTDSSLDSSVKLANLTAQTQTAAEDVTRYYNVIGRLNTNVSLDNVIEMFNNVRKAQTEVGMGTGPTGPAGLLGLNNFPNMSVQQVIDQLRATYNDILKGTGGGDPVRVQKWMEAIGIGPDNIQAIKATKEEYDRLYASPILSGDARDKLVEVAKAEKEVGIQWELTKGILTADFAPSLIEFLTNFNAVLGKTTELTGKVASNVDGMSKKSGMNDSQKRTLANAGAVEVGLGLMAVPSPFFATQAAGGLIILGAGVNDAGKYILGKPSSTGDFIDSMKNFKAGTSSTYSEELMKSQQEQQEDRRRILNDEPLDNKGVGRFSPLSSNSQGGDKITMNVYGTGDARDTALAMLNLLNNRQYRQMETNLGFNSVGAIG